MSESINGWKPPLFFDYSTGERRIASQEDIDRMQRSLRVLGEFYSEVSRRTADAESHLKQQGIIP